MNVYEVKIPSSIIFEGLWIWQVEAKTEKEAKHFILEHKNDKIHGFRRLPIVVNVLAENMTLAKYMRQEQATKN